MRASIPKIAESYSFLINCSSISGGKRNNGTTSENIKCVNLKKKKVNLP